DRDQRAKQGHAADEALGAVDRVEIPSVTLSMRLSHLLAKNSMVWIASRDSAAKLFLDSAIGDGDRRQVFLLFEADGAAEIAQCDRPRDVGEFIAEAHEFSGQGTARRN